MISIHSGHATVDIQTLPAINASEPQRAVLTLTTTDSSTTLRLTLTELEAVIGEFTRAWGDLHILHKRLNTPG